MKDEPKGAEVAPGREACLRRAEDLRAEAAKTRSSAVREQLLLMAEDWEKFAERPGRN